MFKSSDVLAAMRWRYACKKFDSSKKLTDNLVEDLLHVANLTATSLGFQLLKVVVVQNPLLRAQIFEHAYKQQQVLDCSHLFVLCRYNNVDEDLVNEYVSRSASTRNMDLQGPKIQGFKNMVMSTVHQPEDKSKQWMTNQVYIALGNLMTACALLKIDACPMEGFNPAGVDEILNLHDLGLSSILMLPVGYRHEEDLYAAYPKVRRPLSDFVVEL